MAKGSIKSKNNNENSPLSKATGKTSIATQNEISTVFLLKALAEKVNQVLLTGTAFKIYIHVLVNPNSLTD